VAIRVRQLCRQDLRWKRSWWSDGRHPDPKGCTASGCRTNHENANRASIEASSNGTSAARAALFGAGATARHPAAAAAPRDADTGPRRGRSQGDADGHGRRAGSPCAVPPGVASAARTPRGRVCAAVRERGADSRGRAGQVRRFPAGVRRHENARVREAAARVRPEPEQGLERACEKAGKARFGPRAPGRDVSSLWAGLQHVEDWHSPLGLLRSPVWTDRSPPPA
jgi:hypothetical protein